MFPAEPLNEEFKEQEEEDRTGLHKAPIMTTAGTEIVLSEEFEQIMLGGNDQGQQNNGLSNILESTSSDSGLRGGMVCVLEDGEVVGRRYRIVFNARQFA